jgi:sulfonate transport system substrate-binding protein
MVLEGRPVDGSSAPARGFWKVWLVLLLVACGCEQRASAGVARLALDAPIPSEFPRATRLSLGDPVVQKQLQASGALAALPFDVEWQNISGGPNTIEAFRAGVLDGGSVGDTPPIHARFTGLDVKIVAVQQRDKPIYRLAIAPGQRIGSIAELRGKKIAYSPGQAQGALILRVLKKAGLTQSDVQLVQLLSPEFKDALASRQVDAAPLSGTILLRYLNEYRERGASAIDHGVSDSLGFFYVPSSTLADPAKAAALRRYVERRRAAQLWAVKNPERWIDVYYVKDQGLSAEEGRYIVDSTGLPQFPADWSEAISQTQETIDLLAASTGQQAFDAHLIFDRRFQPDAHAAANDGT